MSVTTIGIAVLALAVVCLVLARWRGRRSAGLLALAASGEAAVARAQRTASRLAALEEAAGGLCLELDPDGRILAARGRIDLLPGLSPEPGPACTVDALLGSDGAWVLHEALRAAAERGSDAGKVLRLPGGDPPRWLELGCTRLAAPASEAPTASF